jgi:hypothetical protein
VLTYLNNNIVSIQLDGFCKFWIWENFSFDSMILMLTAHTTIERYLLVFQRAFFHQHLMILHYIPIITCCIYPVILYIYFIFFYPCINQFDFTAILCGAPCYYFEPIISALDLFVDLFLPVAVSTIASIALLSRVITQKHRMQQHQMWRKNRRLVIQLLYIVILHNIIWLPIVICSSIMLFSTVSQPILVDLSINILPNGVYVVILLCPFISLMSLPELWPQLVPRIFPLIRAHNSVRPRVQLPMVHTNFTARATLAKQ